MPSRLAVVRNLVSSSKVIFNGGETVPVVVVHDEIELFQSYPDIGVV